MFLQFKLFAGAAASGRRAEQDQAVHAVRVNNTCAADADTLHAVTICSRVAAAAADSNGSASLMTEIVTAPHTLIEVLAPRQPPAEQQKIIIRQKWTTTA